MGYIKQRGKSFEYAFNGLREAWQQANFKIHIIAAVCVIATGFYFNVSKTDWCLLVICIALVICLELLNSALEKLCDIVEPGSHPGIKFVKDIAAGAVLVVAIGAAIAGCCVFYPYFVERFS